MTKEPLSSPSGRDSSSSSSSCPSWLYEESYYSEPVSYIQQSSIYDSGTLRYHYRSSNPYYPETHQIPDYQLENKYLLGRPPSNLNQNPRGKHHKRPLAWRQSKLAEASSYDTDKYELDAYLWKEKLKQEQQKSGDDAAADDSVPTVNLAVRKPKRQKKNKKRSSQRTKVHNNTSNQRSKVQKLKVPHMMLQVQANKRQNKMYYSRGCSCCYPIAGEDLERWRFKVRNCFVPRMCEEGKELALDYDHVFLPGEEVVSGDRKSVEWEWEREGGEEYFLWDEGDDDGEDHEAMEFEEYEEEEYEKDEEEGADEQVEGDDDEPVQETEDVFWEVVERPPSRMSLMSWEDVFDEREAVPELEPEPAASDLVPRWAVIARATNGQKVFEISYRPKPVATPDWDNVCLAWDDDSKTPWWSE
ncbi:hypothetical protein QBC43DRAFT_358984 [Cladorrhinum sp. PSN259]|nr:hypothetical protein QBC43DRAFT_358984 [Cladorrhinum sp. PSN259]